MIICVCRRVTEKQIIYRASEGKNFTDIQRDLGVATQCGRCEDCARDIVKQCHATSSMTPIGWAPIALAL